MMKDTPEGQTNHCPLCEEAGRKLAAAQAEIERLKDRACAWYKFVSLQTGDVRLLCDIAIERNNLLTNQSNTIELRKEIARLQTTIQGLVAEREELKPVPAVPEGRILLEKDSFCPKCGHNRDASSVSTIDLGEGRKQCQLCATEWTELAAAPQNGKENE